MPRSLQIRQLQSKLRRHHFVGITGPLKSGKSRLCSRIQKSLELEVKDFMEIDEKFKGRAGMKWKVVYVSLTREDNPYDQLTREIVRPDRPTIFSSKDKISPQEERRIKHMLLRNGNEGLVHLYKESAYIQKYNFLIIIDQFENLFFTTKIKQKEKADFIQLLLNASYNTGTIYSMVAFRPPRDERWRDKYRDLSEALVRCEYPLFALNQKELEKAIHTFFQERSILMEKKRNPNLLFLQPYTLKEKTHQALVKELFHEHEPFKKLEKIITEEFIEAHGIPPESLTYNPYTDGNDDVSWGETEFGALGDLVEGSPAYNAESAYSKLNTTLQKRVAKKVMLFLSEKEGKGDLSVTTLGDLIEGIGRYESLIPELISIFSEEHVLATSDHGPADPSLEIRLSNSSVMVDWERLAGWLQEGGISIEGISSSASSGGGSGRVSSGGDSARSASYGGGSSGAANSDLARAAEGTYESFETQLMKRAAKKLFLFMAGLPVEGDLPGGMEREALITGVGRFKPILQGVISDFEGQGVLRTTPDNKVRVGEGGLFTDWGRLASWLNNEGITPDVPKGAASTATNSASTQTASPAPEIPAPTAESKGPAFKPPSSFRKEPVVKKKKVAPAAKAAAPANNQPKVSPNDPEWTKNAESAYYSLDTQLKKRAASKVFLYLAASPEKAYTIDELSTGIGRFQPLIPEVVLHFWNERVLEAEGGGSPQSGAGMKLSDPNGPPNWERFRKWSQN